MTLEVYQRRSSWKKSQFLGVKCQFDKVSHGGILERLQSHLTAAFMMPNKRCLEHTNELVAKIDFTWKWWDATANDPCDGPSRKFLRFFRNFFWLCHWKIKYDWKWNWASQLHILTNTIFKYPLQFNDFSWNRGNRVSGKFLCHFIGNHVGTTAPTFGHEIFKNVGSSLWQCSSTSETIRQLHFPIFLIIFVTSSGTCISPWLWCFIFLLTRSKVFQNGMWHQMVMASSYLRMIRRMCYQPLATMSFSLDTRRVESSLSFTNISLKMIFFPSLHCKRNLRYKRVCYIRRKSSSLWYVEVWEVCS